MLSVVAEQHHRKKAAFKTKGRSKLLTVLLVQDIPLSLPKGAAREKLRKSGQVKDVPFQRFLSEDEVTDLIKEVFSNLGSSMDLQYLQPHKNNTLTAAESKILMVLE